MEEQPKPKQYNNIRPKKWWQKICKRKIDYTELLDRTIYSNVPDEDIPNNKIETSKYNYFTFLPLNIIDQFSKPSNIYFLLIGTLQTIPVISLSGGKPTIFMPLFVLVLVSMIKDFIENLKRRRSDEKENESQVEFLSGVGFVTRKWEDLRVGDIIRVKKDQYFPCDVILLDHPRDQKTAFVQTKNLDGQTNLKLKKTCENLQFLREISDLDLSSLQIQFAFEKPNPFLSTFNGNVKVRNKKFMIENNNVILRGCSLKINEWAIGMCIYTGHQTKILLNSGIKKIKVSSLQQSLGVYFRYTFLFQMTVTLVSAIIFGILYSVNQKDIGYVALTGSIATNVFYTWGSWFISFSNFIPISLIVTIQTVRYGQGMILNKDEQCSSKGQPAEVQTSSINEELGQIRYIMTDKTGTLTQNLMEFKCFYVDNQSFGSPISTERENREDESLRLSSVSDRQSIKDKMEELKIKSQRTPNVDFSQAEREKIIKAIQSGSKHGMKIRQSLLHLALCHNVVPQKSTYTSSSPDQLALVSFAKFIGYQFLQKNDNNELEVLEKIDDKQRKLRYKLLHTLQFSSDRKRMSVILMDLNCQETKIFLLTKGADEVILQRLRKQQKAHESEEKERIVKVLYDYACQGLRTLVLAQRQLNEDDYNSWNHEYNDALTIIGPERYQKIDQVQSFLERELTLVGATAIEDKLQDQVKETIQDLKKSNIKVWMLTGDKKETAISIGFACGLIDKDSQRIVLDCDAEHAKSLLTNLISMLHMIKSQKVTILSGEFIKKIDQQTKKYLQEILSQSQSVICCRVSPKDKEEITKMVRKWGITLAIGDGANDVNMINGANVGVGVRGIEGSQATRAADYIITEFKLLKRLIVYHGLNYYHRNSNVMLYTLYKNMLVTLPNLLYGPLSMESGTYIYDIWSIQFYNIFYVSLPIVYYGLFDILYSWKELKQKPWQYIQGQNSAYFNKRVLIRQYFQVIAYSAFMLYVVYFSSEEQLTGSGYMVYQQWSGNLILAVVVITCNIRVILMSNQVNIMQGFLIGTGIVSYYLITFLISIILQNQIKNTLGHQLGTGLYWILVFLCCFVIEGGKLFLMTLFNMRKVIAKAGKRKEEAMMMGSAQIKEIEMTDNVHKKGIDVKNTQISEKDEIGGYAFAEDDNRNALVTEMQSVLYQKSLHEL